MIEIELTDDELQYLRSLIGERLTHLEEQLNGKREAGAPLSKNLGATRTELQFVSALLKRM